MNIDKLNDLEAEYKATEVFIYDLNEQLNELVDVDDEYLAISVNLAWYEGRQDLIADILEYE